MEGRPFASVLAGLALWVFLGEEYEDLLAGLVGAGVVEGQPAEGVGPGDGVGGGGDEHADNVEGGAVAAGQVEGGGVVVTAVLGGLAGVVGGVPAEPGADGFPGRGVQRVGHVAQGLQLGQGGGGGARLEGLVRRRGQIVGRGQVQAGRVVAVAVAVARVAGLAVGVRSGLG